MNKIGPCKNAVEFSHSLDPKRAFPAGPMNRRYAPNCGRRRSATFAPMAQKSVLPIEPPGVIRREPTDRNPVVSCVLKGGLCLSRVQERRVMSETGRVRSSWSPMSSDIAGSPDMTPQPAPVTARDPQIIDVSNVSKPRLLPDITCRLPNQLCS